MRLLLLIILIAQTACVASSSVLQAEKVQRAPMEKSGVRLVAPTNYEQRVARIDPKTDEPVYYDPRPQIVPVDERAGKYAFKWIGYDGKEKTVIYQRYDAIDAVVSAAAERNDAGRYLYTYRIENLPSSESHLSGFIVQNFAADVEPRKVDEVFVGKMSTDIPQFSEGAWTSFGILPEFSPQVTAGRDIKLELASAAPPGLVACRIRGGTLGFKGAGEHMPTELENAMPGYEELPKGYTVGPIARLNELSRQEHIQYVLGVLPQARKLRWITDSALRWYEGKLKSNDLAAVQERLEHDLKAEQITTEVSAMLRAIGER